MMENINKDWVAMSDSAIISAIGEFIKQKRLQENKSQLLDDVEQNIMICQWRTD